MLSTDSLRQHAQERGMPVGKLRGSAREYLQVVILKTLYGLKAAKPLAFLGGTALRLGYDLPRFSEDLDFDVSELALGAWKSLLEDAAHSLSRRGLIPEVRAEERGSLLAGDLRFAGVLQAYGLSTNASEKLQIKVEANRPRYALPLEPRVVAGYGEMFPVPFAASGLMFAEKIMALQSRELGRDVYDVFFMAGKKWLPEKKVLSAAGLRGDVATRILERVRAWGRIRLRQMARRLEPFLFEPEQGRLVAEAEALLPAALEYLSPTAR